MYINSTFDGIVLVLTFFAISCQIYLFFVVIFKSPPSMKEYRYFLCCFTFWDCVFTVSAGVFMMPEILPSSSSFGAVINGIAADFYNIFGYKAVKFTFSIVIWGGADILQLQDYCLIYRYSVIQQNIERHQKFMSYQSFIIFHIIGYGICFAVATPAYFIIADEEMAKKSAKQLAALKESRQRGLEVRKERSLKKVQQNAVQKSKNIKPKSNDKFFKLLSKHMNDKKSDIRKAKEDLTEERRKRMNAVRENKSTDEAKIVKRIRKSKKEPKPFDKLSRSEKCRRRKQAERIAPGTQLTPSLTVEDTTRMQMEGNFTERDMAVIKKNVPKVAGYFSRNKLKKDIINSHPQQRSVKINENVEIKFFDFGEMLEHDLKTIGVENLPSNLTIVFSGDYGQQTLKIGYYIAERDKPCSSWKFRLIASIEAKEGYEILVAVFMNSLVSLPKWKEGVTVNGKMFICKFILTGDLKFLNMYWGLQCNAATYFCSSCLITKSDLKNGVTLAEPRTIEYIIQDHNKLQGMLTQATSTKEIAKAHQNCHSVKEMPMSEHIEVDNTLHGILHTISGSFGAIMEYAKAIDPACIQKLLKDAHVKLQGYNKKLTGNHGKILLNKLADATVEYTGPAAEIIYTISFIQKYAVARIIDDIEIIELENCIAMFKNLLYQEKYKAIYGKSQHIHVITEHVLPFVKTHRSWGLVSDQPGEAIHKTQRQCFERIPVRTANPIDRNQFFINQTIIRHHLLS